MQPTPRSVEAHSSADPGTGRITGTARIRRTVIGSVQRTEVGQPVQVTCKGCGRAFMTVRREGTVQVPCVHCGCIQSVG